MVKESSKTKTAADKKAGKNEDRDKSPPPAPTVTGNGKVLPTKNKTSDKNPNPTEKSAPKDQVTYAMSGDSPTAPATGAGDHEVENLRSKFMKDLIQDALKDLGFENNKPRRNTRQSDSDMPVLTKISARKRIRHEISSCDSDSEHLPEPRSTKRPKKVPVISDEESQFEFAVDDEQIEALFPESEEEENQDPLEKDWIDEFADEMCQEEKTGPAVPDNLATMVTNMLKKKLPEDRMKDLLDKYPRPSNIDLLAPPRVNNSIWLKLKHETKKQDLKSSQLQEKITKALTANV